METTAHWLKTTDIKYTPSLPLAEPCAQVSAAISGPAGRPADQQGGRDLDDGKSQNNTDSFCVEGEYVTENE